MVVLMNNNFTEIDKIIQGSNRIVLSTHERVWNYIVYIFKSSSTLYGKISNISRTCLTDLYG